jgi:hypothetical protein
MDELKTAERDAVLLRFFENRSWRDIGVALRISEDAARMRVERALERLRSQLERRGVRSTASALGGILIAQSASAAPAGLATTIVSGAVALGASTAGTASFIALMTTPKLILVAAVTLTLAAGGIAIHEARVADRLSSEVAAVRSQLSQTEPALRDAQARAVAAEKVRAELQQAKVRLEAQLQAKSSVTSASDEGKGSRIASGSGSAGISLTDKMNILYGSPEYVRLVMDQSAANIRLQYASLYRKLGLNPEQIQRFEALIQEQSQATFDLFIAARKNGVSIQDPALRQVQGTTMENNVTQLKTLLGPEGFAAYAAYSKAETGSARSSVAQLAANLYATATPLTAEQGEALIQVVTAQTPKPANPSAIFQNPAPPNWDQVYLDAAAFLSPPQLAILRAANDQMRLGMQMSELSDRLIREAGANEARQSGG